MEVKKQYFKLGRWADVVVYICNPDNDFLYLGMISKAINLYYANLYNIIMNLEKMGLIKTKRVGNIRKIVKISDKCYLLAKDIKRVKEVLENEKRKKKRSSTNRKTKSR